MLTTAPSRIHLATILAVAIGVGPLIVTILASEAVANPAGRFDCLDDTPADRESCTTGITSHTNSEGQVVVELATGGGVTMTRCRRQHLPVADANDGPEWVDCFGGARAGWYNARYDCHFVQTEHSRNMDPLDPRVVYPEGVSRGDEGTVYRARCYFEHYTVADGWVNQDYWFLPPGEEPGPTIDPTAQLIADALDSLELYAADIGTAPPTDGVGLVRLPVWLWNNTDDSNWGTNTASVSEAGITVSASATATETVWDTGDGEEVTCDEGEPWVSGVDTLAPPCGHRYLQTSRDQPGGTYTITAVTTWEVEWSVSGGPSAGSGTLTLHPEASVELEIGEVQVLSR
ncbi:hypothetical protein JQS43_16760 [Natronosporangium hydrolyticum]|uniref:Uncharacterized protein n=1 Tax=Natronosporangium hydrolyticum TaxID=2811111 RepID=A0A895YCU8_9ACTN|nr:hypothetical protein [Natronosporangium hydrolyticum]QSB13273.1 hypothetical protein JQS43_16760 [Natronosporangium hydrolyticum]